MLRLIHLHSTMLLLYHIPLHIPQDRYNNLHSTMLLLYPDDPGFIDSHKIFTFHYASTLSMSLGRWRVGVINLHSTMLLLYRMMQKS